MAKTKGQKRPGRQSPEVAEESRRRIVAAARTLFTQHGYEGVGLRDIAAEAGTTHGLVRHHFGSKMGVFEAVAHAADAEFVSALGPLLDMPTEGMAVEAAAAHFIRHFVVVSAQQPDLVGLLLLEGASGGPRLAAILKHLTVARSRLAPMLARLHDRGLLLQFREETFLLFLLFAGGAPFALPALTRGVVGARLAPVDHAEQLVTTLLGKQVRST